MVPDDVATQLVRIGHASLDIVETVAYHEPPADKMLTDSAQKSSRHYFRRHLKGDR